MPQEQGDGHDNDGDERHHQEHVRHVAKRQIEAVWLHPAKLVSLSG
jgi:hypothetical protein